MGKGDVKLNCATNLRILMALMVAVVVMVCNNNATLVLWSTCGKLYIKQELLVPSVLSTVGFDND